MASPQIENGHLDLANELVEALAKTHLSPNESQILWAIFRKTYCWHKKSDWIAFSQFRELTGMIDPHISRTLKKLIKRNILTRTGKEYGLQKNYLNWQVELPKLVSGVTRTGKKKLPKLVDTKEKPKETITKETFPKEKAIVSPDKRNSEVQNLIDFSKTKNFGLQGSQKEQRIYAYNLIRKKEIGLERAKWLVVAAVTGRKDRYAPRINDFKSLFYKWSDLLSYMQTKKKGAVYESVDGQELGGVVRERS